MTTYRLMDGLSGRPGPSGPALVPYTSSPFMAGVKWAVTQGGMWLEGYWWWVPSGGDTAPQTFALWSVVSSTPTGVLIPSATVLSGTLSDVPVGGESGGHWNLIPLATPIQVSISGTYVAATGWTPAVGFPDTQNQFGSGDPYAAGITSGPLTAFSDGTAGGTHNGLYPCPQGLFSAALGADVTLHMPDQGSDSASFGIDVQVSDTAPPGYAGSFRLWPNQADANATVVADASVNYDVATEFALSVPCLISSIWYFSPPAATQLATSASIWGITGGGLTGTPLLTASSPSWSGAAGSGWISTPVSVTLPAGRYKVGGYNGAASPGPCFAKDASTDYWRNGAGANGITNGPISAPDLANASLAYNYNGNAGGTPPFSDGTALAGQSTFSQGPPDAYPYLVALVPTPASGSTQCYFFDVAAAPVPPDTGTGSAALHKMALSGSGGGRDAGGGSVRLPKMSLSATGGGKVTATGSVRLPKMALSGSGRPVTAGTGSAALAKMRLSGTGRGRVTGSGSVRLHKPAAGGAGTAGANGGSAALPKMALSGSGTVTQPPAPASGTVRAAVMALAHVQGGQWP